VGASQRSPPGRPGISLNPSTNFEGDQMVTGSSDLAMSVLAFFGTIFKSFGSGSA
jgi:hypothetical protein